MVIKTEKGVVIPLHHGKLQMDVIQESILRIRAFSENAVPEKEEFVVNPDLPLFDGWKAVENGEEIRIETAKVEAVFSVKKETICFYDRESGAAILQEHTRKINAMSLMEETSGHLQQTFVSPENEVICGLGQQVDGALNYKGRFVHLNQYNIISAVPVLVSSNGYGLFWNNCSLTEINREKEHIPLKFNPYTKTWKASFTAKETGDHIFISEKLNKNLTYEKVEITVGGQAVIRNETMWHPNYYTGNIRLEAGKTYPIFADATVNLYVQPPSTGRFTSIWSEMGNCIDYFFLYGPGIDSVIAGYRYVTGTAPMFARWAFGYWQSREHYKTGEELLEVVREYRKRNHPIDCIVQDWHYWRDYGWNALKFHPDYSENIREIIEQLHREHVRLMVTVWPNFGESETNDAYQDFKKKGYLMDDASLEDLGDYTAALQGMKKNFYDPFNRQARDEFWKKVKQGLFDNGVDAWWLDASEPNLWSIQGAFHMYETCMGPAAEYLNAYPLLHSKGFYENQRAATKDKRAFLLSRTGFSGIQKYGTAVWSGDTWCSWDVLRKHIVGGIQYCLSGLPYWTTDIGGFSGGDRTAPEFRELYIRWFQFGVFCPIFRAHGTSTPREIWQFGEEAEEILHKYLIQRYRLIPYLYSLAWMVTKDHYTILRGLIMDFRQDERALSIRDQFMFGPALLVCPVTTGGAESREVYLPECAGWYDFWTNAFYQGGQSILSEAPIDRIPLYVRAGSILVLGPERVHAEQKVDAPVEIRVYAGEDAKFVLYDDHGDGYDYESGEYCEIRLDWKESRKELVIGPQMGRFNGMAEQYEWKAAVITKKSFCESRSSGIGYRKFRQTGNESLAVCFEKEE